MSGSVFARLRPALRRVARNPHFWVVIVLSAWLLFIYQAWPWPERRFASGAWRFFAWLSALEPLVVKVEVNYHIFGVLFLIPIIYGSLTLSWPGGIFAWFLALIWVLPTLLSWSNSVHWISLALLLVAGAARRHGHRRATVARTREAVLHRARGRATDVHRQAGRDSRGRAQAHRPGATR